MRTIRILCTVIATTTIMRALYCRIKRTYQFNALIYSDTVVRCGKSVQFSSVY